MKMMLFHRSQCYYWLLPALIQLTAIYYCDFIDSKSIIHLLLNAAQTYFTGRDNVYLGTKAIFLWIFNAVWYTMIICLISFNVLPKTFIDLSLYRAGTIVYVGMVMALQAKVAFFHHQWAYPQILAMVISVGGMFIYFLILAASTYDYYYVANMTYELPIFWFFGFFTIPLIAVMVDAVGHYTYMFFWPSRDMLYREKELEVCSDWLMVWLLVCVDVIVW